MSKNNLIAAILIALIFLLWVQYNNHNKIEELKVKAAETAALEKAGGKASDKAASSTSATSAALAQNDSGLAGIKNDSLVQAPLRTIEIETHKFIVVLKTKGAALYGLTSKEKIGKDPNKQHELVKQNDEGILGMELEGSDLSQITWHLDSNVSDKNIVDKDSLSLSFYTDVKGRRISRTYTFYPDSQLFKHSMAFDKEFESGSIMWPSGLNETEELPNGKGMGLTSNFFSEIILNSGGQSVYRETVKEKKVFEKTEGVVRWIGLRRKYLATIINFNQETNHTVVGKPLSITMENEMPTYALTIYGKGMNQRDLSFSFLVLPLKNENLLSYGDGYEKILFSGWDFLGADVWYPKLCGTILKTLNFFYGIVPNYGIAIILLTLVVRMILLPLTISQTRSMSKMQEHAPAIKAIKEANKGNAAKANQEVMAYYKKAGVNPLAGMIGCLPMFLQFPVFISLFNVLGRAVELKGAPFFLWVQDLSHPDVIISSVHIPWVFPLGITILPFFMAITMFFQTKLTITDPNQKAMVYMMPVMMFLFSSSFPSGLVVYWTVSNIFTIGQTLLLKKKPKGVIPDAITVSSKPVKAKKKK